MNIFISWSGSISHRVALIFRDWLPNVIQAINPYVSSEDIDKGARWSTDIAKELENASYGIICLTKDNIQSPWINFEAGALSKAVDKSRVTPFLFNLKRSEVQGPMLQFQSTIFEKEDFKKLIFSINAALDKSTLDESRLLTVFEMWWPTIDKQLKAIPPQNEPFEINKSAEKTMSVDSAAILEEILDLVRNQQKMLVNFSEIDISGKLLMLQRKLESAPEIIRPVASILPLKERVSEIERQMILQELQANDGNVSKTADVLGVSRPTLYDKLKALNIEISKASTIVS